MGGFKRGFYTTSKKLERKPESNLGQSSFPQPQPFSQSQQPGEEQKQVQKTVHATTQTLQEKPRKQMKSALHQEVSEFNPSSQISMEQLVKVVLNLQEEVQKLKNLNEKLMLKLKEKNEMDESRIDNYERQMDAFFNMQNHQDMNTTTLKDLVMKQEQEIQLLKESRMEQLNTGSILMVVEPQAQPRMRLILIRKRCFCCGSQQHLY